MLCECCANLVSPKDFRFLSNNPRYKEPNVYIIHRVHDNVQGDKILEVIDTCGELKLVRLES